MLDNNHLSKIVLAIFCINVGVLLLLPKVWAPGDARAYLFLFIILSLLTTLLIFALKRWAPVPELVEGELPKEKKDKEKSYLGQVVNILVWLGLALGAALLSLIVWLFLKY